MTFFRDYFHLTALLPLNYWTSICHLVANCVCFDYTNFWIQLLKKKNLIGTMQVPFFIEHWSTFKLNSTKLINDGEQWNSNFIGSRNWTNKIWIQLLKNRIETSKWSWIDYTCLLIGGDKNVSVKDTAPLIGNVTTTRSL